MKESSAAAKMPSASAAKPALLGGKALREGGGLVSQMASKFQQQQTTETPKTASVHSTQSLPHSVRHKKTSDSVLYSSTAAKEPVSPLRKTSVVVTSVARTESHQARFNSARAMFEKMGSADDLDSITSSTPPGGNNRGSRASSVQRSRSTSPFNSKVGSNAGPPRSPEVIEPVCHF